MAVDGPRVWWLYGPPCAGKSATAWEVHEHLLAGQPRAHLDVDQVGLCYPEPEDDPGRHRLEARTAGALVRRFAEAGARTTVVSGVLDPGSVAEVVEQAGGLPVAFCRLRTDRRELRRRLEARYGPGDVARALAEAHEWDQHDPGHPVVDTDAGTPRDVARRVVEVLSADDESARTAPAPPSRPPAPAPGPTPSAGPTAPERTVLVCGPTGVGTSTLGFGSFLGLLGAGRPSAYVDLQQIGFLAGVPDDGSRGHRLGAECLADLWTRYREVGARQLVVAGHVEHDEDVQRYRVALGGTPLVVCRLRAGREALRERLTARSRGEGPPLAGDALAGLTADEVDAVLERSLAQQAQLEQAGIGDVVLDTDGRDVEACVRELRSLLGEQPDADADQLVAPPSSDHDS